MFEFLEPIQLQDIFEDTIFKKGQYGELIEKYTNEQIDWQLADIILIGINDNRGNGLVKNTNQVNVIRKQFYNLFCWHNHIKIADIGNVKIGKTIADTYAAAQQIISELLNQKKTVIILGGSHNNTLAQYYAYTKNKTRIEATCIDAKIDLSLETTFPAENFLVEMLTKEPIYVHHYNHLGFQSYFVHPTMMETLDKLRFDCYRVGKIRENLNLYEPIFRNSNMVSIDINALQNKVMPCNTLTPNGFDGDEACTLAKYAGNSNTLSSFGIYNYNSEKDIDEIGATQIAQMIWYFIDGRNNLLTEKNISQKEYFNEYSTAFADVNIVFYQNKINNKWWMQLPNNKYIACNKEDYIMASQNDIPEIWLRYQERLID